MSITTTSQLTQILGLFGVILVLYILFGVLFLVFSHLQERLQRRPDLEYPLRYSWARSPDPSHKDLEAGMVSSEQCATCSGFPLTIQIRYENATENAK
ncbi:hypothetical protein C8R46DRAFT_1221734 [Mycena filopes]|nr:hypothetical protein C8R46DRAFT_1221734 [Mycena filopes]